MNKENYIDIKNCFKMKRIMLILLITICSSILVGILSKYRFQPEYQAKCSVILGKDSADKITGSEIAMYQSLIKTYSEIARTRIVAEAASERLNLGISPEELMTNMNVITEEGTQIMYITYLSNKPEDAVKKANALSESFVEESQRLLPTASVKIMDMAITGRATTTLNLKLNIVLGFLLGLMVSLGLVFLLEYLDNTIKNDNDVENYLSLPMIGSIPKQTKMTNLLLEKDTKSTVTEAYKIIRTNLLFSMQNRSIKTLIICSSSPKEGKTTIASNVAIAIAQTGKKILLIDCNFRKPYIHKFFDLTNDMGLRDILFEGKKVNEAIVQIESNFHVLTSGITPYNPSELLSSLKMKNLIKELEGGYDFIVLDTPPLIAFTDALTLATNKFGVMVVVSAGDSKIEICKKSKQLLLNVNATLLGIVLNKVEKRSFVGYGSDYFLYEKEKKIKNIKKANYAKL